MYKLTNSQSSPKNCDTKAILIKKKTVKPLKNGHLNLGETALVIGGYE